jgi:succinate dehydrogenase/fumarate reductase flavoprotein subunit
MNPPGYDLIVVGAGTAGLPCAIEAAGGGGRVLLIEKAESIGGTLQVSGGHMSAAGTKRQQEKGIADSRESHRADIERISRGTVRSDIVDAVLERAAATVDWLQDHGFDFAPETPRLVYGHEPYSTPRTYYGADEGRSILAVLERLLAPHRESGAVTLRLRCAASRLRLESGRVSGVVFREDGFGEEEAKAGAVVLTTGGYGSAPDLFAEIDKRPLVSAAQPTATGDGLRMARTLGAALAGQGAFLPTFGGLPAEDPGRVQWKDRPLLVATERPPWEIYVDRAGHRWIAEDEPSIDLKEQALAAIPDLTFFTVFDERAVDASPNMVVGWSANDLRERAGRRAGVFTGPTLAELAKKAGIDPPGLESSIARYNTFVSGQSDPDFGRRHLPAPIATPPFYAMENHGITLITFAGLDVDALMRVRTTSGDIIPGLYAAGEIIGAAATCGHSFCGGMMVTPALVFGRLLGQRLARRPDP